MAWYQSDHVGMRTSGDAERRARWMGLAGPLLGWLLVSALSGPPPALGQRPPVPVIPVVVAPVTERAVGEEVTFIGTVEPDHAVTVQAEVQGRVIRADLREGERVVEGRTILAELDRTSKKLELQEARALAAKAREEWQKLRRGSRPEEIDEARQAVARAEARLRDLLAGARSQELEQARSAVAAAEVTRIQAEREFRRMEQLAAQGLVATQERERAWHEYEVAKSRERSAREQLALLEAGTRQEQIEAARAEVRQAQERLKLIEAGPRPEEIAQAEAEYRRATAAVERVEAGAWVRPGDPVADLIDLDPVYVVGPVNEREIARLRLRGPARVRLDAYPDRAFRGEVAQIIPQADPQSRAFPVKVRIANPDHLIKSGMLARVTLEIGGGRKGVFVSKDAVVQREGGAGVFVVLDGVARYRPIRAGRAEGGLVEVTDGSLSAGEEVVVLGNEALQDGAKVRKVASKPAGASGGRR